MNATRTKKNRPVTLTEFERFAWENKERDAETVGRELNRTADEVYKAIVRAQTKLIDMANNESYEANL